MNNSCQLSTITNEFTKYLESQAYQQKIPLHGTFELTARCNFNCKMCYVHLNEAQVNQIGKELTNEEWLDVAQQAREAGTLYLTLTGGEVFARPGFKELYIELSKMGFLIQILSNGYLIDESVMEWLKEYPPYSIRITLYGTSNEIYKAVCGIPDAFDKVAHAIDLIQEADIPFYMVGTIVKENAEDLPNMYAFTRKKGILFQHTIALVKAVRGATANVEEHRIDLHALTEEEKQKVQKVERLYPPNQNLLSICASYRKAFWLTWNGNMQLCSFMNNPVISIHQFSFSKAWDKLLEELEVISSPSNCNQCKYEGFCKKCPGVLEAECGSYDQVTDSFCLEAKKCYEIYHLDKETLL